MNRRLPSRLLAVTAAAFSFAAAAAVAAEPARVNTLTLRLLALEGVAGAAAGANAVVDVGSVSALARGEGKGRIQVRKQIGLRLDGPGGSARVSVFLLNDMPGCTVRVDGHAITAIPRMIAPVHRIGSTVAHEIELTIPAGVPAGPFLGNLQWVAETD